ncbi:TIGR02466 family protein [Pacificimonas flava]|uniref:Fe2OG dioxygenase domain-containing protein n=1 Tax=Pacificimonas flava TaxID=1234595 RepID=M2SGL3_9SPHN|nr:TIGR02466 family protein [Pacificimonas flava]EMD84515.1 hypothetical protein C725_0445 [Pacificimonas flava]MBB5279613.1 uncharacterized protein (TIGR02466 family) [Pacificimonas flava]
MASANYEVKPLFAEPYFVADMGDAITPEHIKFIKELKMVQNQQNLISENLYIFEKPELKSLKQAVDAMLGTYAAEVMGIPQELYVTQSWSLINPPGIGMHGHSHSNSVISGSLYFTDMPSPPSRMVFHRHRGYQQLDLIPENGKINIYNTRNNVVEPKKNMLVLFSSGLEHFVEPNTSSEPRHSIAFNTFLRGTLGNFRDVSELKLA